MRIPQHLIQRLVIISLLVGCLGGSASAERIVNVIFPQNAVVGEDTLATIEVSKPAPEGGTKIIIFPAHRLELPDTVIVPEGESTVDFEFTPFRTHIEELLRTQNTTVSTLFKGKIQEWPGPRVLEAKSRNRGPRGI
jgi:hypothetical protein